MTVLLDLLWSLTAVGLSLYLGLSLVQQDPKEHPAAAVPLWLLVAVGHWGLWQESVSVLVYFPAGVLLAWVFRTSYSIAWFYAGAAAMLSFIILEIVELLRMAGTSPLIALALLALLAVFTWQGATLLPKESSLVPTGEQRKAVHFGLHMGGSLVALVAVQLWLCGLLAVGDRLDPIDLLVVLAASGVLCGLLLFFIRFVSFGTMERIEAVVDKQYQAELLNLMQVIRAQRHDFNIHIQSLAGMLEQGSLEECRTYLTQMLQLTNAMNDILPLHDPAVSAMLNSFREIAAQKHITMDISIADDLEHLPCTVYEINTVIGNLLQNAIDEVEQQSEGWIRVSLLKRGGKHIVKVTNPCTAAAQDLACIFQLGYSTKPSHSGIGLATVERIVTRCGGSVNPEWKDGTLIMIVRLPAVHA